MKKIFTLILVTLLLSGCVKEPKEKISTNSIFKKELETISKIEDAKGKILVDTLLIENVQEVFDGIFDLAIFESSNVVYGEVTQGAGSDGNGGKVFCCKLPVEVNFVGTKESVERFVRYFSELDNVISFCNFKVEALDNQRYEVTTLINFLGKSTEEKIAENKKQYSVQKNTIEVEEVEDTALRSFDISMVIRPSNSDSSAISLGVVSDKDYRIYSDKNENQSVKVVFYREGKGYYCEYSIGDEKIKKSEISPDGDILFDILSCELVEADDEIMTDLHIINNSDKKVSIIIYEDEDERVKIVEKVGNVEVKNRWEKIIEVIL